jgi:hypothetical protein
VVLVGTAVAIVTAPSAMFDGLFDDAALFPPASLPLPDAVRQHHEHQGSWYADLVGPLVVTELQLRPLTRLLTADTEPLPISLIVSSGPPGVGAAVVAALADPRLRLVAIDVASAPGHSVLGARHALAQHVPDWVIGYVEIGWDAGENALDELAGWSYRAKWRTGGATARAFPATEVLATGLVACVQRQIGIKCTAGLHRAIGHTAPGTGFEHHGFLNLLLAIDAARSGRPVDDVATLLAERDAAVVTSAIRAQDAAAVRHSLASVSTCSIAEPVDDLVALGLVRRSAEQVLR